MADNPQLTQSDIRLAVECIFLDDWFPWRGKGVGTPGYAAAVADGLCPACVIDGHPRALVLKDDGWAYCPMASLRFQIRGLLLLNEGEKNE